MNSAILPPGSNAYYDELEWRARKNLANTYEKSKIKEKTKLYYNFFTKKHKNLLNSGKMTNANIRRMAHNQAVKNTKRNGGKHSKQKTQKKRR